MRKLQRADLVDYQTYVDRRDAERERILPIKAARRVHVGEHLTFLFENTDTVRYQVQEMMRAEHIVREGDIQHEIETYNELLGDRGELGCTLLIEIDDPATRDRLLRAWLGLPQHVYLRLADGSTCRPRWDARQIDDERLSAVQYLRFPVGKSRPVALGANHPSLTIEAELTLEQQRTLEQDAATE